MNILEKEIEDVVFQCSNEVLRSRGLLIYGNKIRQLNLGSYGIADLVTIRFNKKYNTCISIQVIELKKDTIDVNSLMQCARYAIGIKRYLTTVKKINDYKISFECMLIGKQIQLNGDFVFLSDLFKVKCYEYRIDIVDGIKFVRQHGFHVSNEYFPPQLNDTYLDLLPNLKDAIRYNEQA